jgi:plasmid stabilization system protein ParE
MSGPVTYEVQISEPAMADIRQIHRYIVDNFYSMQAADGKVDLIFEAFGILKTFPEGFPTLESRGIVDPELLGYRFFPVESWIIFYSVVDHTVTIGRVLGAKQNWIKILRR